jgi:hypothetical protein
VVASGHGQVEGTVPACSMQIEEDHVVQSV